MRIYAISDIHVDYDENKTWLNNLSKYEYIDDIIIVAGDISDNIQLIEETFIAFGKRFSKVFFVPGNHELWVKRDKTMNSLEKFFKILQIADQYGIYTKPLSVGKVSVVPLYSWYDYTFGRPDSDLISSWADYLYCCWPEGCDIETISEKFFMLNVENLKITNEYIISFSHFLPTLELILIKGLKRKYFLNPVLGSSFLHEQIKKLKSKLHVYGHSHINFCREVDGTMYINNAYGYPHEKHIAAKKLMCIHDFS